MLLTSTLLLSTFIGISAANPTLNPRINDDTCWPLTENSPDAPLTVLKTSQSPHGFTRPLRGWNSWGIQATPGTTPSYPSDLGRLINQQCSVLANDADLRHAGYTLCSLDGGWYYTSLTDKYGRVTYNESLFDMPRLGRYLHSQGLKFGLYAQPGIPCEARDKTIFNTNVTIGSAFTDHIDNNNNCYFDYDNTAT